MKFYLSINVSTKPITTELQCTVIWLAFYPLTGFLRLLFSIVPCSVDVPGCGKVSKTNPSQSMFLTELMMTGVSPERAHCDKFH